MKNYIMIDEATGKQHFNANSESGRGFIAVANGIAALADDADDPLVSDEIKIADDGIAEAFFHDSTNCYYVRDESGAALNYASAL